MSTPRIAVLRQNIHGLSADDYASALRDRLPEADIAVAQTPADERDLLESVPIATGFSLGEEQIERATNLDLFACVYAGVGHLSARASSTGWSRSASTRSAFGTPRRRAGQPTRYSVSTGFTTRSRERTTSCWPVR